MLDYCRFSSSAAQATLLVDFCVLGASISLWLFTSTTKPCQSRPRLQAVQAEPEAIFIMHSSTQSIIILLIFVNAELAYNFASGQDCQCVSIFLCGEQPNVDRHGNKIELQPEGRTIERTKNDCDSSLEICCEFKNIIPETEETSAMGCGIRNFNGIDTRMAKDSYEAKFGEFPWTIAILHNTPEKQDEFICDGTLIHQKVVLTTAHCVIGKTASDIKIRAGEWDTQSIDESLPHQDRKVDDIVIHEKYNSKFFYNDIALLILSRSLEITENVNIICLPESTDEFEQSECVTSGWSRNKFGGSHEEVLMKQELQIISHAYCQKKLRQSRLGTNFVLDRSFICATGANSNWKADGGSSFICPLKTDSRRFVQVGVAFRSIGYSGRTPNVFANVLYARPWIDKQLLFYNLDNTVYQHKQYSHDIYSAL